MRLTLRTLLAYLDDVLDPVDKEELSQKIDSSEFAEELVHRTRDTMRRLRLSAPQMIGTGMGLDPNTVSEYLDNVLPPDSVGDFERICLESDVHLAEAAACHHVLTMILGEPADVDPRARQRMYSIALEANERRQLRVEPAHAPMSAAATAAAPMTRAAAMVPPAAAAETTTEIPEYLRTSSWWNSRGAVFALAAGVLIAVSILLVSGVRDWFGKQESVAALDRLPAPTFDANQPEAPAEAMPPEPVATEPPEAVVESATAGEANANAGLGAPPPQLTSAIPAPTAATPASPPDRYGLNNGAPSATATTDATVGAAGPNEAAQPQSPPPATAIATTPPVSVAAQETPPPTSSIPPEPPANTPPPDATAPAVPLAAPPDAAAAVDAAVGTPPADVAASPPTVAPAGPGRPVELGTYMGGRTVLLRFDEPTATWYRMEPRSAVIAGERLLAMPEFRPITRFLSGIQMDMSGGTQVVVGTGNEPQGGGAMAAVPTLEVVYGRIILANSADAANQVHLLLGPYAAQATLAPKATLGIEVERLYVPGNDPRKTPAPVVARLFAADGGVEWKDSGSAATIDKASRWSISAEGTSEIAADPSPPDWLSGEPVDHLSEQKYGAPTIDEKIRSDAPVDTQLLELFQGSGRKELKSLVARSAIHVGVFQPFIDALRDSEQKANWKTHIDTLRAAMALNPESSEKVWQTLVEQRGRPMATDLYEMLCGYNADQIGQTPDQIKTGALSRLINWLDEDSLDYRVLAVNDLAEITGKRLMSNPAGNATDRKNAVRSWRRRLETGELQPVANP